MFAILFHTTLAFSQTKHTGYISLMAGPAFPSGHFANTNLFDQASGFAKAGEAISLSYTKHVSTDWGLSIGLAAQRNPINTGAFESSFSKAKIYQGFSFGSNPNNPPQVDYVIYRNWNFETKSWLYAALQRGIKREFSLNNQRTALLVTNANVGVLYVTSPQLKGSSITDTATAIITQNKSSGFGLIYSLGVGMNYYLNKTIFLTSTLNYTGTNNVSFNDVKSTLLITKGMVGSANYSVQQSTVTANGKQALSSINLLVGIGFVL